MQQLQIGTVRKQAVVDITDRVRTTLPQAGTGVATVFVAHTTAALATVDLDPGTDLDFLDFLRGITPNVQWRHPHNPEHTPDHLLASLIGPSVNVPYQDGKLLLGIWQRIVLVELDGPRERKVVVHV